MMILYCILSLGIVGVMFVIWVERRNDFLSACERFYAIKGYRHHLDPKATMNDLQKNFFDLSRGSR